MIKIIEFKKLFILKECFYKKTIKSIIKDGYICKIYDKYITQLNQISKITFCSNNTFNCFFVKRNKEDLFLVKITFYDYYECSHEKNKNMIDNIKLKLEYYIDKSVLPSFAIETYLFLSLLNKNNRFKFNKNQGKILLINLNELIIETFSDYTFEHGY